MKQALHILATVRKAELLQAATLVFQTLRVGFPTAEVFVWGNALDHESAGRIARFVEAVGGRFQNLAHTSHDAWIESLLQRSLEGFWICDTDVVFTGRIEPETESSRDRIMGILKGRFEPEFLEEWTGTRHMARLHTAVMWLDAPRLRSAMREWMARIPVPWRNTAEFDLVRQHFVPLRREENLAAKERKERKGETLFYDTCAGLWHAIGGRPFTAEENGCFEHLHCATYVDEMGHEGLKNFHARVYADPKAAVGAQIEQEKYYGERRPKEPMTMIKSAAKERKEHKGKK